MALIGSTNAEKIWNYFISKGFNAYGVAALLGNLDAESGLRPNNLQDCFEGKYTDNSYMIAVDNGTYTNFANDGYGWGISQLTYHTRKRKFLQFVKSKGKSIGDLEIQVEFLYKELIESFTSVANVLRNATSVEQASTYVLFHFENPLDKSIDVQNKRASFGQKYYMLFVTNKQENEMEDESNMGYKKFAKGQNIKLSAHFNSSEFDCHGNGCCSQTIVNELLIEYLEKIREHFGVPVTITSPYRCEVHNKRIGGAVGSRHSKGDAADIVVKGVSPRKVAQYAESIGILGIGLYETSADGFFVHIDTRNYKSFWYGQSEKKMTTFGAYINNVPDTGNNSTNTSVVDTILNYGDKGDAVKRLQENLNRLDCDCGTPDGIFGNATLAAVRKFQKKKNLSVDGIAGSQTLAAIEKAIAELDSNSNKIRITASLLNVRSGAGMNYPVVGGVRKGATFVLVDEENGWGKINNPTGWISMQYTEKI